MSGTARHAVDQAAQRAEQAAQKGEQLYHRATDQAERQAVRLADVIKEQPIVSALVAIAAGYLLGRISSIGRR